MERWSNCPGSVRLSEGIESRTSVYAEEGTKAHELAAEILEHFKRGQELTLQDVDEEMLEHVSVYTDSVMNLVRQATQTKGSFFLIEHKFDLSEVHPGLFGTADAVIYDAKAQTLYVWDLKYGQGIAVDAENNVQLKYYGLGALLSAKVPCREVELVIAQPRCAHVDGPIRRHRFDSFDLLEFAASLKEFAVKTEDPNAPLNPGDHCRFCPAAGICPAVHEKALMLAREEFSQVLSYDPEKLSKTLNWLPVVEAWIENVRAFAYGEAEHGRCPPGWKLVQKRPTRKWKTNIDVAFEVMSKFDLDPKDIYEEPAVKSPAQMEKLLRKEERERLEVLIEKKSSGYALAHESDKRPAARLDAASEFSEITD